MTKIKRCPFCGTQRFYFDECDQGVYAYCPICNIDVLLLTNSYTEASRKWNRRVKE